MVTMNMGILCLVILIISIVMTILGVVNDFMFMVGQFLWAFTICLIFFSCVH